MRTLRPRLTSAITAAALDGWSVQYISASPLVGEFEFNGKDVFVIANHFDAKLGARQRRVREPDQRPRPAGRGHQTLTEP